MTNQFMSFIRFLFASVYGLLSNPVAMRRVALIVVVVALIVVAIIVPSVTTLAGGLSGGDPH